MQARIDRALKILGIKNFLLGIHDAAFPGLSHEDLGRGTPYSKGAAEFLQFARALGFNGIQLGPQGITTAANLSPYDGSYFSRNPLSLSLQALTSQDPPLLDDRLLSRLVAESPDDSGRVNDRFARKAIDEICAAVCLRYRQEKNKEHSPLRAMLDDNFAAFCRRNSAWLGRDALYEVLKKQYGGKTWRYWDEDEKGRLDKNLFSQPACLRELACLRYGALQRLYSEEIEDYCFIQFLLAEQHRELRNSCGRLGLKLFGDCQIGLSGRDAWAAQSFLLPDYVMGAPPSRTNPEGQPWNYPVFDPHHYFVGENGEQGEGQRPGPVIRFLQQRMDKLTDEFDGLRLDHPHGLICPWVYRPSRLDPYAAVQNGARLFASPRDTGHPQLAQYAIVRQEQIDTAKSRYDDSWVTALDERQVRRYARLFDVLVRKARDKWSGLDTIACEILSTQPYPIKRVMERYGLGRFRVTQKADLNNIRDVYRSENGRPEDWLMLGNHDTAPIRQVVRRWQQEGAAGRHACYLAGRLHIAEDRRAGWIEQVENDTGALSQAKFAELFIGPARNVMVFFTDLLGGNDSYNRPGTISEDNWTLRVPRDYQKSYSEKSGKNLALNIPKALAAALRSKGEATVAEHHQLINDLEHCC